MFTEKRINVGVGGQYQTIAEALKKHQRGHLHIVLTSDVLDEENIDIPSSLKSVQIATYKDVQIHFQKNHMKIHCNGVSGIFEHLGTKESSVGIVGTKRDHHTVSITLNHCLVDYVVGAHDVENVEDLSLNMTDSKVELVTGFLNNDQDVVCQSMNIKLSRVLIETLQGITVTNNKKEKKIHLKAGEMTVHDSLITKINILKGKARREDKCNIKLIVTGETIIAGGLN